MRRSRLLAVGCGVAVLGLATGLGARALAGPTDRPAAGTTAPDGARRELVPVESRDLERSKTFTGSVDRGDSHRVAVAAQGTVTGLPAIGDVVSSGQPLLEVDGRPIVYLAGDRPAWRTLGPGTKGEDVRQLEAALVGLGYAHADELEVDDRWQPATTTAVKAFQKALGLAADGQLDLGEVVFGPAPLRVAEVKADLGSSAASAELAVTSQPPAISASVRTADADLLRLGTDVAVTLPSGASFTATVSEVGVPRRDEEGETRVPVRLAAEGLDGLDGAPVEIEATVVAVEDATAVPVEAVLALAEGGYAVEVPDASRPSGTRFVPVDLGEFADGWVQVTGGVAVGDQVVVP